MIKRGPYLKKRVTTKIRLVDGVPHKDCSVCLEVKPLTEFYTVRKNKPQAACKVCLFAYERIRHATWYNAKHREICDSYRDNLKREVYQAYGNSCACCGETHEEFLQIDHVNGGGRKHRKEIGSGNLNLWLKRRGFPKDGFRLLCSNCNHSMGVHGYCPHERERTNKICAD
jgi:hypothetical protein